MLMYTALYKRGWWNDDYHDLTLSIVARNMVNCSTSTVSPNAEVKRCWTNPLHSRIDCRVRLLQQSLSDKPPTLAFLWWSAHSWIDKDLGTVR
jgi:hypothetical protein